MTIRRTILRAAFFALAIPAAQAQAAPKPPTPPDVLGAARTIQFTATYIKDGKPEEVSMAYLAQPNQAFVQDTDAKTKVVDTVYACNGKTQIEYRASRSHYTKSDAPARFGDADTRTLALSELTDFLDSAAFAKFQYLHTGPMKPGKKSVAVYNKGTGQDEQGRSTEEDVYVDPATGLPVEISFSVDVNGPQAFDRLFKETAKIEFTNWKLNQPLNAALFHYTPPAAATIYTPPKLLADGTVAPDFTANDKDGHPVKLSDYKGRVVVLDFWATWCGPCQMSLPHTASIAQKDEGKGVVVLAVNVWDKPDAFQAWLPKHPQYGALHFAIDPAQVQDKGIATALYGVSGIPTQYVIGKDGKIVQSIVGYDEGSPALEDALKAAGIG